MRMLIAMLLCLSLPAGPALAQAARAPQKDAKGQTGARAQAPAKQELKANERMRTCRERAQEKNLRGEALEKFLTSCQGR